MRSSFVVALATAAALVACKKSAPAKREAPPATAGSDAWASTAPPPAAKPLIQRPFFFSATKDGKTLYLLGTMHLGIDAEKQLPKWVFTKLDQARAFAMEVDTSDPSMVTLLVRTDGKTLSDELGPAHWAKLQEAIGPALADGMNKMKPFAAMSALGMKDLPMTAPMDAVLFQRAKDAGKPIVFLETIAAQLAAIDPYATAEDIRAGLDNPDYSKKATQALVAAYVAGEATTMRQLFDDKTLWVAAGRDPKRYGEFLDATLKHRNASWIPQLEQIAADGGGFIAVGAGHLVGPDNVPDMLAARGFTITRMIGL
jgi:uncharacterized protein YbaP (TraB family)